MAVFNYIFVKGSISFTKFTLKTKEKKPEKCSRKCIKASDKGCSCTHLG
jgi:hypothetical protein